MSTLTSSSTLAVVEAAYDDNASYAEDASVAKAKAFVTACRFLKRRLAADWSHGTHRISLQENLRQLDNEIEEAQDYIRSNDSTATSAVRHVSFAEFRT